MGSGKRNLKEKRESKKLKLENAICECASFVGLPRCKFSTLEILICASAKMGFVVRGDIHPNQQILDLYGKINKAPCIVVNKTKKEFFNSRSWKILRYQAFEAYGNKCACCGATPDDGITLHVDHIKPKSTHPELALDINNLQILCEDCSTGKINQWDTNWRA